MTMERNDTREVSTEVTHGGKEDGEGRLSHCLAFLGRLQVHLRSHVNLACQRLRATLDASVCLRSRWSMHTAGA